MHFHFILNLYYLMNNNDQKFWLINHGIFMNHLVTHWLKVSSLIMKYHIQAQQQSFAEEELIRFQINKISVEATTRKGVAIIFVKSSSLIFSFMPFAVLGKIVLQDRILSKFNYRNMKCSKCHSKYWSGII